MLTTVPYKVNILGPVYFDICHATGSRFVLLEFVRMSYAVHHDAGMWLSKCQIQFHRQPIRSTFILVCIYYIYISLCAGNCGCVSFHFWMCLQSCEIQLLTSSCLSVHLSSWKNSAPTGQIFLISGNWLFLKNLSRKCEFQYNQTWIMGALHEADRYT
jgi:hypothetical protein